MEMFIKSLASAFAQLLGGAGLMAEEAIQMLDAVNTRSRDLALSILSAVVSQEVGVIDEVHASFKQVKADAWTVEKSIAQARCVAKREKGKSFSRKACKVCGTRHAFGEWKTSAAGLAGSTLKAAQKVVRSLARRLCRLEERLANGKYSGKALDAAKVEVKAISRYLQEARDYRDDIHVSAVGLAGSTLETAHKAVLGLIRKARRMKGRLAKGEYTGETLVAAKAEIKAISQDIQEAKKQCDDAHKALLRTMFPGEPGKRGRILKLGTTKVKGIHYIVGNNTEELRAIKTRFLADRVVLKVVGLCPALAAKSPRTLQAYLDTPEDSDGFPATEFFEDPDTVLHLARLTAEEMWHWVKSNYDWPGQVLETSAGFVPAFVPDPDDTDASPVTIGDEYGLRRLHELLGHLLRRSDVLILEDDYVAVPTRLEVRDPQDLCRMTALIFQGHLEGVKKPYGFETSWLRNDARPIGHGSRVVHHAPQYSRKGVEDMIAKVTAIAMFWLSGEAQDGDLLPAKPPAKRVRDPRPVVGRYIRALESGFEWVWDHQYHITPIVQTFREGRGLWLLIQNLSSRQELVSAVRLTGPAADRIIEQA